MTPPNEFTPTAPYDDFERTLKPLWMRGQRGDSSAYREALATIAQRLRRFYGRRLQALPDEVEDLVQETLLALHLQRGTYDETLPVSSWVFAIARHKLVDLWRRRGRKESLNDSLDELTEDQHPFAPEELPSKRDLSVLLEQLPESQKQAILLTKIEGLSMVEASNRSGVSVAALKVQVHRGLKQLAALVREES
ncbi:RNA polymerase sigma-70 factor (ECF subfamily) [Limnobacter thiooxidans]|uniref:Sigma-70 family RNA polymerase sigma factor n=1 Tax=Limnobacter thiooxidans TaxID=131080 RepID=A0AA86MHN4_9BURK|nr:sigma-70 family RNA polymerase sigma factor [Limnobacter sp.]MCZ8014070.1 sigma-70 family RNA polymerase sigma factor [Limnobacter sp.]RZS38236.1 RNA polymerase sigma-70 factor (ECF subfamily) [Limnobacter thiooxidans]BET25317.1 sigma-70 family RNA polymerase sigma factor [Limnobacter thiooxidans]